MPSPIIKVSNLSKRYRIGAAEKRHKSFREAIIDSISAPVRNLSRLQNLTRFKNGDEEDVVWALKDVSFEVNEGEVLGIIGKNGSGKSTLLKILSRITEPTSGRAEIQGRVSSLLEVGTGFHPELTGRENIFLNGTILGMRKKEIEKKFDEIVAFSEIEKFIDTPVKRYSSGMYVRLAFAVAAHLDPEILLVDEVLAVGDYAFQNKCLGKMGDMSREKRTVVVVSHNMYSIANLCARVILLDSGSIVKDGPPDKVIDFYLKSGQINRSEMVWTDPAEAPGDDRVRWNSIRVLSENGEPANQLDLAKDIIIQANYCCMKDGALLIPGYMLFNQMGIEILESNPVTGIYADHDKPYDFSHKKGSYQVDFRLPANLLNEGSYGIEFGFFGVPTMGKKNTLSFHVYDSGSNPKPDGHPWRGVIRANVVWSMKYLGKKSG